MTENLQGKCFLITRPIHQAKNLAELIQAHGGKSIIFPTIEIIPPKDLFALENCIKNLDQFDVIIFTSANAVWHSAQFLRQYWPTLPVQIKVIAIGNGTKKALQQTNINVDQVPQHFSSEGLAALPELQQVTHKKILIMTGEAPSDTLATILQQRGAEVSFAYAYQRKRPQANIDKVLGQCQQNTVCAIIATSSEALTNLFAMSGQKGQTILKNLPIVGVSARIKSVAQQLGCTYEPIIAANADDSAIVETLIMTNKLTPDDEKLSADILTPATEASSSIAENNVAPKSAASNFVGIVSVLALIIAIVSVLISIYMGNKTHAVNNAQEQLIQTANNNADLITNLQQQIATLQNQLKNNDTQIALAQNDIQSLTAQREQPSNALHWLEVRHLLQLAQLSLHFQHDTQSAITLLSSAMQQLPPLTDTNTLALKQQMSNALTTLQALPKINKADLLIQLNSLSLQMLNLPLIANDFPQKNSVIPVIHDFNQSRWRTYWQRSLNTLAKLVVIRHYDKPVMPLISPQQQLYLINNIQEKFSQASWAVLHNDQKIYQTSLMQCVTWIKQYYNLDATSTQVMLQTIQQLQDIELVPNYPDLSQSIKSVDELISSQKS